MYVLCVNYNLVNQVEHIQSSTLNSSLVPRGLPQATRDSVKRTVTIITNFQNLQNLFYYAT